MKTISFRSLAVGAIAVLAFTANAAAGTGSSGVLNVLEVRQLIARGDAADHARLAVHFAALADHYAADAKRHEALANAFVGSPSRYVARGNPHCRRLAELNAQSAATLRELAEHHERLAAGVPSTVPRNNAAFEAGEGARDPTDAELNALAIEAQTPADHRAVEEYFLTRAKRYTRDANDHAAMARAYMAAARTHFDAVDHCDRLTKLSRESAKEATEAAALHRELARVAR
jgi:hypothetical protein